MPMAKKTTEKYDTVFFSGGKSMVNKSTKLGETSYPFDEIWNRNLANNHIQYTVNLRQAKEHDSKTLAPEKQTTLPFQARYIRNTAKCRMSLPSNHPGVGNPAWIFVDEIVVK